MSPQRETAPASREVEAVPSTESVPGVDCFGNCRGQAAAVAFAVNRIFADPVPPLVKCGTLCQDFEDAMCEACESPVKGKGCSQWSSCLKGDPGDWAWEMMCGYCHEVDGVKGTT